MGQCWTQRGNTVTAGATAGTSSAFDPGVVQFSTGTTSTAGRSTISTGAALFFTGVARIRFSVYFMVDTLPNGTNSYQVVMGLTNKAGAAGGVVATVAADTAINFQFDVDNGAPTIQLVTADNGGSIGSQSSDQGTIAAATWHFLEFEVDAGRTAVNWWHNFHKQTAITTHIPPTGTGMGVALGITKTATGAGTAARTLNVDVVSVYGDYVTG
jgi:hypothetical protein